MTVCANGMRSGAAPQGARASTKAWNSLCCVTPSSSCSVDLLLSAAIAFLASDSMHLAISDSVAGSVGAGGLRRLLNAESRLPTPRALVASRDAPRPAAGPADHASKSRPASACFADSDRPFL